MIRFLCFSSINTSLLVIIGVSFLVLTNIACFQTLETTSWAIPHYQLFNCIAILSSPLSCLTLPSQQQYKRRKHSIEEWSFFSPTIPSSILNYPLHSFQNRNEPHSSLPPSTSNPHVSTSHPYMHSMYSGSYLNRSDSIPLSNCPSHSRLSLHQYTPKTTTALSPQ